MNDSKIKRTIDETMEVFLQLKFGTGMLRLALEDLSKKAQDKDIQECLDLTCSEISNASDHLYAAEEELQKALERL